MYGARENFKDTKNISEEASRVISDNGFSLSYKKTNKLITALFMVTDIMEKDEPIRLKLRMLSIEILSDTTHLSKSNFSHNTDTDIIKKVQEALHLIELAETINSISKMNASILKKEFLELKNSLEGYKDQITNFAGKATLSEFFNTEEKFLITPPIRSDKYSIGHINSTRIGVQKGSTLLKALSDRMSGSATTKMSVSSNPKVSLNKNNNSVKNKNNDYPRDRESFDVLKKQRRSEILDIVKSSSQGADGASITDIRNSLKGSLVSSSEKTLQRELVSMVSEGVLKKSGSKRWSRYSASK